MPERLKKSDVLKLLQVWGANCLRQLVHSTGEKIPAISVLQKFEA